MHKKDVPQDAGMAGRWRVVCYAVDDDGSYVGVESRGWEPANVANRQAWERIAADIRAARQRVEQGRVSPLAFHMACHQMDVGLLASYAGISRWRVRRHLRPRVFAALAEEWLARYGQLFGLPPEGVRRLPERDPEFPHAGADAPAGGPR